MVDLAARVSASHVRTRPDHSQSAWAETLLDLVDELQGGEIDDVGVGQVDDEATRAEIDQAGEEVLGSALIAVPSGSRRRDGSSRR